MKSGCINATFYGMKLRTKDLKYQIDVRVYGSECSIAHAR